MTKETELPSLPEQIQLLEKELKSLLSEEDVLWDEVNSVERELKHLRGLSELNREQSSSLKPTNEAPEKACDSPSDPPYAAEDAAMAMMESAIKKKNQ